MLRRSKSDQSGSGTRILVVNDDRDSCELVARIVENAGWAAERAYGHEEALQTLLKASPPFTAALLDFSTGGTGSSLSLLDAIRNEPKLAETVVILLTRSDSNRLFAWQSGADGFLIRPFHADELVNELYAVFTRTPQEREAVRQEQLEAG